MLPQGTAPAEGEIWGQLDNGLKYAIIPSQPEEKVISLRLVVAAGRAHEPEKAAGVADVVQRLAFNRTGSFDRPAITEFLLENGIDLQRRSHAQTELYHTLYELDLDHGPEEGLETGLRLFADIAGNLEFDPVEVEWIKSTLLQQIDSRAVSLQTQAGGLDQVLYRNSPYAEIDDASFRRGLSALEAEDVKRFWDRAYRPERMTLFVTGAVDSSEVEGLVQSTLQGLAARGGDDLKKLSDPAGRLRSQGDVEVAGSKGAFSRYAISYVSPGFDLYEPEDERRYYELDLIGRYAQSLASHAEAPNRDVVHMHRSRLMLILEGRGTVMQFQEQLREADRAVHRLLQYGIRAEDLGKLKADYRALTSGFDTDLSARGWAPMLANRLVQCLVQRVPFRQGAAFSNYIDDTLEGITPERTQQVCAEIFELKRLTYFIELPESFMLSSKAISKRLKSMRKGYDFTWERAGEVKKDWDLTAGFAASGMVESSAPMDLGQHQAFRYVFRNKLRLNVLTTTNNPGEIRMRLSLGNGMTDLKRPFAGVEPLTRSLLPKMTVGKIGNVLKAPTVAEVLQAKGLQALEAGANLDQFYWMARGENEEDVAEFLSTLTLWMVTGALDEEKFDEEIEAMTRIAKMDMGMSPYRRVDELLYGDDARLRNSFQESDLEAVDYESFTNWVKDARESGYLELTIVGDFEPRTILRDVRKSVGAVPDRTGKVIQPRHGKAADYPKPGITHEVFESASDVGYASAYWALPEDASCRSDMQLTALQALLAEHVAQEARKRRESILSATVEKMGHDMVPQSRGLRVDVKCPPTERDEAERFLLALSSSFPEFLTPELVKAAERAAWIDLKRVTRSDTQLALALDQSQGKPNELKCLVESLTAGVEYDLESYRSLATRLFDEANVRGFTLMPESK